MSIAAKLDANARIPGRAKIGSHDLHRSAKEGEGRTVHEPELKRQQPGNSSDTGLPEDLDGIKMARLQLPEFRPAHMRSLGQAVLFGIGTLCHRELPGAQA
jgi:hypothetical protein